jgi:hypothetical protein
MFHFVINFLISLVVFFLLIDTFPWVYLCRRVQKYVQLSCAFSKRNRMVLSWKRKKNQGIEWLWINKQSLIISWRNTIRWLLEVRVRFCWNLPSGSTSSRSWYSDAHVLWKLINHGVRHNWEDKNEVNSSNKLISILTNIKKENSHRVDEYWQQCSVIIWGLFSFQNFAKFFKISSHIESLDACMKH